jgi:hypothetical protein
MKEKTDPLLIHPSSFTLHPSSFTLSVQAVALAEKGVGTYCGAPLLGITTKDS